MTGSNIKSRNIWFDGSFQHKYEGVVWEPLRQLSIHVPIYKKLSTFCYFYHLKFVLLKTKQFVVILMDLNFGNMNWPLYSTCDLSLNSFVLNKCLNFLNTSFFKLLFQIIILCLNVNGNFPKIFMIFQRLIFFSTLPVIRSSQFV